MIKVILWDVDRTLLDFPAAEQAALKRCFEIFHLGECSDAMVAEYVAINTRYWEMLERGEKTKKEILVERFAAFFSLHGIDAGVAPAFNDEYQHRLGDTVRFLPYAEETVSALKGRVLQCAVTNGTKIAQDEKLKKSGLDRLFDYIFISEELGAEKPNKAFFDRVFAAIGPYEKNEVMIVGDSLTSDMQGGCNAGVVTCWFREEGTVNNTSLRIDHEIQCIHEVLALI